MKYLNIAIALLMALFAAVQLNDPDSALWIVIYLIPAVWAALAAFRPAAFGDARVLAGLCVTLLAALIGTVHYWPTTPGWWRQEVWWDVETAREGMGMMIVSLALAVVLLTALRARARAPHRA